MFLRSHKAGQFEQTLTPSELANILARTAVSTGITGKLKTFSLTGQEPEELQQKWAQLEHVAPLVTLGELTASLSHELNESLCAILLNISVGIELLDKPQPDLQKIREMFFDIERITERAGEAIRGMRHMLKRDTPTSPKVRSE